MNRRALPLATPFVALALAGAAACSSGNGDTPTSGGPGAMDAGGSPSDGSVAQDAGDGSIPPPPFQADPPAVYVAKVKNLLVGLPPTDAEVKQVVADPTQLATLIGTWQQLPEYQTKMLRFFQLAFQQTQLTAADFADQAYPRNIVGNGAAAPLLVQNVQESFARTMNALTAQGQPLTLGVTTHQVMMTTALKELYAFLDVWNVDDASKVEDHWRQANPSLSITVEASQGPIPIADSVNPSSPNFMHWYDPDVGTSAVSTTAGCNNDPIVYTGTQVNASVLHYLLYGSLSAWTGTGGAKCNIYGGTQKDWQVTTNDFSDWQMVTLRPPKSGESVTPFYDLGSLRTAKELVLSVPRVGFFSTPAFAANWQTNTSNTMRVTMNQILIVALGSAMDGTDTTVPTSTPGLDTTHNQQADCYACHKLLDPTRSILSANWSWNYHGQVDPTWSAQPGLFAFRGVIAPVQTLDDLASTLVAHPYFPAAWVQKLCYYANSSPCDATDPVFTKIVADFQASKYDWNALVKELLSSPIVTNAAPTATSMQNGEIVAVERRDHLCAAINARLGFTDVCGLSAMTTKTYASTTVPEIGQGLPSDAYGRGGVAPVLPNSPTLFFRAGTENICEALAAETIDVPTSKQLPGVKQWTSAQATAAIGDFVGIVMGLVPSDPRYAQAQTLLTQHFQDAQKQSGITPTAALQSTFVAACLAPSAVSMGM